MTSSTPSLSHMSPPPLARHPPSSTRASTLIHTRTASSTRPHRPSPPSRPSLDAVCQCVCPSAHLAAVGVAGGRGRWAEAVAVYPLPRARPRARHLLAPPSPARWRLSSTSTSVRAAQAESGRARVHSSEPLDRLVFLKKEDITKLENVNLVLINPLMKPYYSAIKKNVEKRVIQMILKVVLLTKLTITEKCSINH